MCGPFSSSTTRRPASARRSAGAAAPNPVPMIRTSVVTTDMGAPSSGVVAGRGQRAGQEPLGIGIGEGVEPLEAVHALVADRGAAGRAVVNPAVVADLREIDGAGVELLRRPVGVRQAVLDHGGALLQREPIEIARSEQALGARAQVVGEKRAILGER